jgi:predicted permease
VTAASVTSRVPLSGRSMGTDVMAEVTQTEASATFSSLAPHYFEAMRIDLVRGRDFTAADVSGAPAVAIVNQTLARRLWPNADAIGKRLRAEGRNQPWREVVGVARDGKYVSLTEPPRGAFYLPMAQHPASPVTLVVRTAGDAGELMRGLTGIVQGLDRDMPIFGIQTLEATTRQVVDRQRAAASLLGVFGTIAVLLAAVGIYGVAAHTVSLRIREIGIRMALGARAANVLWMFVRETVKITVIGVVLGLTLSAAASQALTAFLFDLRPTDAVTFGAAATIVSLVATVASYVPARRAARVDPLRALRQD